MIRPDDLVRERISCQFLAPLSEVFVRGVSLAGGYFSKISCARFVAFCIIGVGS